MRQYAKICCVMVCIFSVLWGFSRDSCASDSRRIKNENGALESAQTQMAYEGLYEASDGSELSITRAGDGYGITISLFRLTFLDDGTGRFDAKRNVLSFVATDASDNPIGGEIRWKDADHVIARFTKSTWNYLPNGTEFSFERSKAGNVAR